jgi:hypothetical protein
VILIYYYYFYAVSCHRPVLLGTPLEPTVIPNTQASSFRLKYFCIMSHVQSIAVFLYWLLLLALLLLLLFLYLHVFLILKMKYKKRVQCVLSKIMYDMMKLAQGLSGKYPAILNISRTSHVALM